MDLILSDTGRHALVLLLGAIGTGFMLLSSIGINRLPDLFARMHALGMASSLGISLLLLAAGLHFTESNQFMRMAVLIGLFFVTGPIATTTMARAAYRILKPADKFVLRCDAMAEAEQESVPPAAG